MITQMSAVEPLLGNLLVSQVREILGLDSDAPVEIQADGQGLVIRRAKAHPREQLRDAAHRAMAAHAATLWELDL